MNIAYKVLVRKPEVKRPLGRSRRRWEDLRERDWEVVNWIHLAQDRNWWRPVVNTAMNLRVP
jgi:hypothetical protein